MTADITEACLRQVDCLRQVPCLRQVACRQVTSGPAEAASHGKHPGEHEIAKGNQPRGGVAADMLCGRKHCHSAALSRGEGPTVRATARINL